MGDETLFSFSSRPMPDHRQTKAGVGTRDIANHLDEPRACERSPCALADARLCKPLTWYSFPSVR